MSKTITIASDARTAPFRKTFKRCVGAGRADLALRQDYVRNLRVAQREIGFEMIRCHGIFSDQAGAYTRHHQHGSSGSIVEYDPPLLNFRRAFQIVDNWLSAGIRPMLELGFMPEDMAEAHDRHVFWWKGNVSAPADIAEWRRLIEVFIRELVARYGADTVRRWPVEVWNEPSCNFFQPLAADKMDAHFRMYRAAAEAVKSVRSEIQVGGPATQGGQVQWISYLIGRCVAENVPIDFASHHAYATRAKEESGEFSYMELGPPELLLTRFDNIIRAVRESPRSDLPIHVSEWNTSYSCLDPVHDSALNAAYVASILTRMDGLVDSFSYWTFCDVFEEQGVPRAPFHGGFGLLTEEGLPKPTFWAFEFANRLHGNVLYRDECACVTGDGQGTYAALFYNPCITLGKEREAAIDLIVPAPAGQMRVVTREVNDVAGNACEAWKRLGRPRYPTAREMEILKRKQCPDVNIGLAPARDGAAHVSVRVPPNGLALVEVEAFEDRSSEYRGLRSERSDREGRNYS